MLPTTTPANDSHPLPAGTTHETAVWRLSRRDSYIELVALANAGKRGKTCCVMTIRGDLDRLAPDLLDAVQRDSTDGVFAAIVDANVDMSSRRGIDVPQPGAVRVESERVRAYFDSTEFRATFRDPIGGGLTQDSHLYSRSRRDAGKALAWAKANEARLPSMSRAEAWAELSAAGVRCDSHG